MNFIYTDGSCINNGKINAKSGIGIYFKDNDKRNLSQELDKSFKQTNNTAELYAIIKAIKIIETDLQNNIKYIIYTDSNYSILCSTNYEKWIQNKKKDEIQNIELVKQLFNLVQKYSIELLHIDAHTNNTDIHSKGNEQADLLASKAIGLEVKKCLSVDKVYLNIPYKNKDKAKILGAKWDNDKKRWFYTSDINDNDIKKIKELEEIENKINININFANKDKAKILGARWSASDKSWYYVDTLDNEKILALQKLCN